MAMKLSELEPENPTPFTILSDIYAAIGRLLDNINFYQLLGGHANVRKSQQSRLAEKADRPLARLYGLRKSRMVSHFRLTSSPCKLHPTCMALHGLSTSFLWPSLHAIASYRQPISCAYFSWHPSLVCWSTQASKRPKVAAP